MSKLSPALKALISAPFARPNTLPAPPKIHALYSDLLQEARSHNVGIPAWLTLSTAATMTMNSPASMTELYNLATSNSKDKMQSIEIAELMREIGLKCIGFNGIPRTINCLGAFRESLPEEIASSLSTEPTRTPTPTNLPQIISRGTSLWKSIYAPFETKLIHKLSLSHPDLPIHILNHEYGALFSDFPQSASASSPNTRVGRVLTSIVAISGLRAQTGVGPQVISHVFGLRKAFLDGTAGGEGEVKVQGGEWLAGDEGSIWILEAVDRIVGVIGEGRGSSFAEVGGRGGGEGEKAKL